MVYGIGDPVLAVAGLAIVGAFVLVRRWRAVPDLSAILILVLGVALGVLAGGVPAPAVPLPYPVLPAAADWLPALLVLVLPQAVLTLTNSIAATELLARDLLPRPPTAGLLSRMIGAMNLVAVPLGGIPMCHGAGGLAAQYRFGGRTGWSNAIAGLVLVAIAFFASSEGAVALFPTGLLAALLLVVALETRPRGPPDRRPDPDRGRGRRLARRGPDRRVRRGLARPPGPRAVAAETAQVLGTGLTGGGRTTYA